MTWPAFFFWWLMLSFAVALVFSALRLAVHHNIRTRDRLGITYSPSWEKQRDDREAWEKP